MKLIVNKFRISEEGNSIDIKLSLSDSNYVIKNIYIDNQSTYSGTWSGFPSSHPIYKKSYVDSPVQSIEETIPISELSFFDTKFAKNVKGVCERLKVKPHRMYTLRNNLLILYVEWSSKNTTETIADLSKPHVIYNSSGIKVDIGSNKTIGLVPIITVDWKGYYDAAIAVLKELDHCQCDAYRCTPPKFQIDFILRSKAIEFGLRAGDYTMVIDMWKRTFIDPNLERRVYNFKSSECIAD